MTDFFHPDQFLQWHESLRALALHASEKILAIYHHDKHWQVQEKADHSPLTAADLASHQCICAGLQALTPHIPVLSEESSAADIANRLTWPTCWLVDPLDGTREFLARNDEFTINIALIHQQEVVLGLIHIPARAETYIASKARGAKKYHGTVVENLQASAQDTLRFLHSRHHQTAADSELLTQLTQQFSDITLLQKGSAIKFCAIAEGSANMYARFGPTMEWDTAAGHCLVKEAGAVFYGLDGQEFSYNARPTLKNGPFMVASKEYRHLLDVWKSLAPTA